MAELVTTMFVVGVLTVVVSMGSKSVLESNENRAADANVDRVLLAQQTFANLYGSYTGFPSDLGLIDGLTATVDISDGPSVVSIALGTAGTLGIAAKQDDNICIMISAEPLAAGGKVTKYESTGQACNASSVLGDESVADVVSMLPA